MPAQKSPATPEGKKPPSQWAIRELPMAAGLLSASSKDHDPTLGTLFSCSIGPAIRNPSSRYAVTSTRPRPPPPRPGPSVQDKGQDTANEAGEEDSEDDGEDEEEDEGADEEDQDTDRSEADGEEDDDETEDDGGDGDDDDDEADKTGDQHSQDEHPAVVPTREKERAEARPVSRKRKRPDALDDLEGWYLSKLSRQEDAEMEAERAAKKTKQSSTTPVQPDLSPTSDEDRDSDEEGDAAAVVHESLLPSDGAEAELEKAARTVFLSNVAAAAASSKSGRKTLMAHLSSVLTPPAKIASIRFRSVAFSTMALPKRAAYITGAVMEATTRSSNAYVVYPTAAAARRAADELNGTIVLDRHLRVDSVAHPSPTASRRCVFVGNLTFIDDETVTATDRTTGTTTTRKRTKIPADVEEGLWRTFSTAGRRVENVRVVRDPRTRVGKGFAYVQFYDENDVESALLLSGKKFPPMLPRPLRVTRAKAPHKTALAMERAKVKSRSEAETAAAAAISASKAKANPFGAEAHTPEQRSLSGRAAKLLGRSAKHHHEHQQHQKHTGGAIGAVGAPGANRMPMSFRSPEKVIAEGRRASAKDALPKGLRPGRGKKQRPKGAGRKAAMESRGGKRAAAWRKSEKSSSRSG